MRRIFVHLMNEKVSWVSVLNVLNCMIAVLAYSVFGIGCRFMFDVGR